MNQNPPQFSLQHISLSLSLFKLYHPTHIHRTESNTHHHHPHCHPSPDNIHHHL
ncbi:hypothetical protein Hanom_Chr03g00239311 [Helianthus anomalus]